MTAGPPDGMVPHGYGAMRTSTADRERAIDVLKAAFAEGRLDQHEYADRVGLVYTSRTYGELAALTADLPIGPLGTLPPAQGQPMAMPVAFVPSPPPEPLRRPGPPARPQTNGTAVAAFFFALGGYVTDGITAPLALVLAIAAAVKIWRTGERGDALAAGAIVLVILQLLLFLATPHQ